MPFPYFLHVILRDGFFSIGPRRASWRIALLLGFFSQIVASWWKVRDIRFRRNRIPQTDLSASLLLHSCRVAMFSGTSEIVPSFPLGFDRTATLPSSLLRDLSTGSYFLSIEQRALLDSLMPVSISMGEWHVWDEGTWQRVRVGQKAVRGVMCHVSWSMFVVVIQDPNEWDDVAPRSHFRKIATWHVLIGWIRI